MLHYMEVAIITTVLEQPNPIIECLHNLHLPSFHVCVSRLQDQIANTRDKSACKKSAHLGKRQEY